MSHSRHESNRRAGSGHHRPDAEGEELRSPRCHREDEERLPKVPEPAEGQAGPNDHESDDRSGSEQRDGTHGRREPPDPVRRDEGQDRGVKSSELVVCDDVLQDPSEGDGAGRQRDQPGGEEDPGGAFRAKSPQQEFEGGAVAVPKRQ